MWRSFNSSLIKFVCFQFSSFLNEENQTLSTIQRHTNAQYSFSVVYLYIWKHIKYWTRILESPEIQYVFSVHSNFQSPLLPFNPFVPPPPLLLPPPKNFVRPTLFKIVFVIILHLQSPTKWVDFDAVFQNLPDKCLQDPYSWVWKQISI